MTLQLLHRVPMPLHQRHRESADRTRQAAPRWRVRCPKCGEEYLTVGWPRGVTKRQTCGECALKRTLGRRGP
jgi:hypothetical protein